MSYHLVPPRSSAAPKRTTKPFHPHCAGQMARLFFFIPKPHPPRYPSFSSSKRRSGPPPSTAALQGGSEKNGAALSARPFFFRSERKPVRPPCNATFQVASEIPPVPRTSRLRFATPRQAGPLPNSISLSFLFNHQPFNN
jgi:hypothetical protein